MLRSTGKVGLFVFGLAWFVVLFNISALFFCLCVPMANYFTLILRGDDNLPDLGATLLSMLAPVVSLGLVLPTSGVAMVVGTAVYFLRRSELSGLQKIGSGGFLGMVAGAVTFWVSRYELGNEILGTMLLFSPTVLLVASVAYGLTLGLAYMGVVVASARIKSSLVSS